MSASCLLSMDHPLYKVRGFSRLVELLKGYPDLVLAFSGGVDSAFLLAVAKVAGISPILPVTVVTDFFPSREKERVGRLGAELGVAPVFISVDILNADGVAGNDARRCYFCKKYLFSQVKAMADVRVCKTLVHGANLDDLKDYRPGMEAALELGFKAPLVEAGFTKQQIRDCSKLLGLSTWDLPSQSCLATRVPQGESITREKLKRVELAENFLFEKGFGRVRVRCHGDLARIETEPEVFPRFLDPGIRLRVQQAFHDAGFDYVCLDLNGYRPSGLNAPIKEQTRQE